MNAYNAIAFHNTIASAFTEKYESSKAFRERFLVWTALFGRYIDSTDHVIDLGCGPGIFSNYLANKGCSVIGLDGSVAMIAICNQAKSSTNVRYIVQSLPLTDLLQYPLQDVVLMSSLLEYIPDMPGMIDQVRALLKPNGLLIVSIPNARSLYRTIERTLFRLTKRPKYFAYIRHASTEIIFNQQLTTLGFDTLETAYFSSQDPISRLLRPFLADKYVNNLFVGVYRKRDS